GRRSTNSGDVVGLEVVDDIRQSVEAVLDGEGHNVMAGPEELGDLDSSLVVGSSGEADGEAVELGEVGGGREVVVVVDADEALATVSVGGVAVGDGLLGLLL